MARKFEEIIKQKHLLEHLADLQREKGNPVEIIPDFVFNFPSRQLLIFKDAAESLRNSYFRFIGIDKQRWNSRSAKMRSPRKHPERLN